MADYCVEDLSSPPVTELHLTIVFKSNIFLAYSLTESINSLTLNMPHAISKMFLVS